MPTLIVIGGGGGSYEGPGESEYREGESVTFPDTDITRRNMTEDLRRSLGQRRDDLRSQKNLQRFMRGRRAPRRT